MAGQSIITDARNKCGSEEMDHYVNMYQGVKWYQPYVGEKEWGQPCME